MNGWLTSAAMSATGEIPRALFGPVRAEPFAALREPLAAWDPLNVPLTTFKATAGHSVQITIATSAIRHLLRGTLFQPRVSNRPGKTPSHRPNKAGQRFWATLTAIAIATSPRSSVASPMKS